MMRLARYAPSERLVMIYDRSIGVDVPSGHLHFPDLSPPTILPGASLGLSPSFAAPRVPFGIRNPAQFSRTLRTRALAEG